MTLDPGARGAITEITGGGRLVGGAFVYDPKEVARDHPHDGPSPWLDKVLVSSREKVSWGFVADNPGKWMLHCHMLEHQAAGMVTWFEVSG